MRGRDTKPEAQIRDFMREAGVVFEMHVESLPGTPDIVCASAKAVVFVHGCFQHLHGCRRHKSKMNRDYWEAKFAANIARDRAAADVLRADGWRVLTVWECEARAGRNCRDRLLRVFAPDRRVCHDCSTVAAPGYSMCVRCYRRARTGEPAAPSPRKRDKDPRPRRRRLHLCVSCGMPAGDKYSMCPSHAERLGARRSGRSYVDEYARLAAEGKCRCHSPVKPGSTRCEKCLRKLRRDAKKRNKRYRDANRCRRCPLPPLPGRIWCEAHQTKVRAEMRETTARFIKKRRDNEQCVKCGKPSKTYNCEQCRKKIAKRVNKKKQENT